MKTLTNSVKINNFEWHKTSLALLKIKYWEMELGLKTLAIDFLYIEFKWENVRR